MAVVGAMATPEDPDAMQVDMGRLQTLGRTALAEQVQPGSARAEALVRELLDDGRTLQRTGAQCWPTDWRRSPTPASSGTGAARGAQRWPAWEPSVPAVDWWIQALRS
jgi:hypothetical protein